MLGQPCSERYSQKLAWGNAVPEHSTWKLSPGAVLFQSVPRQQKQESWWLITGDFTGEGMTQGEQMCCENRKTLPVF